MPVKKEVEIYVDLVRPGIERQALIELRHNDENQLAITTGRNGQVDSLSAMGVTTVTLSVERSDGTVITIPGTIDGDKAVYILDGDSLAKKGKVKATSMYYDADLNRISTATFEFKALEDPTADGSTLQQHEKTLVEVVLGDGPQILADAQEKIVELDTVIDQNYFNFVGDVATRSAIPVESEREFGDAWFVIDEGATVRWNGTALELRNTNNPSQIQNLSVQLAEMALPKSNGIDDTEMINTALQNKGVVRGLPGEEYIISASLVIPSNTRLDMSDCKVKWKPGVDGDALITNLAFTPQRVLSDASMVAASTTLDSPNGNFTIEDIGRTICITGAGGAVGSPTILTADILEILSGTSVRLSKIAKNTVTNAAARVHNRDKNISVIGGIWDRGDAVGLSGQKLHGLNFRHVENLTIDVESYRSTQHGAKYAFLLGNARHSKVSCRYMDTISDGVHLNGPCSFIDIPFLGGKTGDDFISLTGADYPHYADTAGDITDVNVGTIMIDDALAGYKILAGQGNYIDNFTAGNSYGSTRSYAAWVGTDENYPDTMGGTYGKIDVGSIFIHSGSDLLRIVDVTADIIKVKPKGTASIQLVRILENTSKVGGVINNLIIEEANIPDNRVIFLKEGANSVLKRVTISNSFGDGSGYIANVSGGIIEDLSVEKSTMRYSGSIAPVVISGGVINHLKIIDSDIDVSASTGVGALVQKTSGIGAKKVTLSRGSLTGAGSARGLVGYNPSSDPFELVLDQVRLVSLKRLLDGLSANVDVILINPQINTALEPLHIGNSALTTTITGTLAKMTGASTFLSSTSVGNIRANGITIPVRVSLLSPIEGDQVRNTDSSANSGWYLGVVAWDGSKWIPVRGYALHGNVTLQSGGVTIAHNRVTATSRIRLYRLTPGGTPGALYVDSITSGTGFSIKSTNTGDTSAIRYEIVTY